MRSVAIQSIIEGADVTNTKVIVNPKKSIAIQEALLDRGWMWKGGQMEVLNTGRKYLFLRKGNKMQYGSSFYPDLFKDDEAVRISVKL